MIREKRDLVSSWTKAQSMIVEQTGSKLTRLRRVYIRDPDVRAQTI